MGAINFVQNTIHIPTNTARIKYVQEQLGDGLGEVLFPAVFVGVVSTRGQVHICKSDVTNIEDYNSTIAIEEDIFRDKIRFDKGGSSILSRRIIVQ